MAHAARTLLQTLVASGLSREKQGPWYSGILWVYGASQWNTSMWCTSGSFPGWITASYCGKDYSEHRRFVNRTTRSYPHGGAYLHDVVLGAQCGRQPVHVTPVRRVVCRHLDLAVEDVMPPGVSGVRRGWSRVLQQLCPLHTAVSGTRHVQALQPEQGASAPRPHDVCRAILNAGSDLLLGLYRLGRFVKSKHKAFIEPTSMT